MSSFASEENREENLEEVDNKVLRQHCHSSTLKTCITKRPLSLDTSLLFVFNGHNHQRIWPNLFIALHPNHKNDGKNSAYLLPEVNFSSKDGAEGRTFNVRKLQFTPLPFVPHSSSPNRMYPPTTLLSILKSCAATSTLRHYLSPTNSSTSTFELAKDAHMASRRPFPPPFTIRPIASLPREWVVIRMGVLELASHFR